LQLRKPDRDPETLILAEATNALDLISEHLVQDALKVFAAGRSVIVIAHRISTIENADQVIVLDGGRVLVFGKVEDLVASGGYFSRLYALEFKQRHAASGGEEFRDTGLARSRSRSG
jgi:subfamily B ATP-binding cassette protein MsbA